MDLTKDGAIVVAGTVKLQSRFHKLAFKAVFNTDNFTTAENALYAAKIEGSKTDKNGTEKTLLKQSLGDALEIASYNKGSVVAYLNDDDKVVFEGSLELTPSGSINPPENTTYYFAIENMPAGSELYIDALPTKELAISRFKYDQIAVSANVETPVNIAQAKWLALPKNDLVELQLFYPNGFKQELSPRELKRICAELNDLSFVVDGKAVVGSNRLYVINVVEATQALITSSSIGNVYVVKEIANN